MKKFITYVSMQPKGRLEKLKYVPVDNPKIKEDSEVYFPVSILIESFAGAGERIEVVCVMERDNPNIEINFEILKEEIGSICDALGAQADIEPLYTDKEERAASHLGTFKSLIEAIKDGDNIYACCTFGTKPIPVIEMMAMNYAYRVRDNVSIEAVVYGKVDRNGQAVVGAYLYDVTALFYMNQIVNSLAEQRVSNPDEIMKNLLGIEDATEE